MASRPEKAPKGKAKDPFAGLKPELYVGRGQTFAKHVLLKQYLTRLTFKVLQAPNPPAEFLYLDAFSGPWQAQGEAFEDTSFAIALRLLTEVRDTLAAGGRYPRMRAIFVEKRKDSYERLCQEIAKFPRICVQAFNDEFQDVVPQVTAMLTRDTFLFGFLDPIGWKGIPLQRIAPLLRHRPSEVLINVMTNSLVRHAENESVRESYDELFGDREWRAELPEAERRFGSRDAALIQLYLRRLKKVGGFTFVGSTRIRNPDKDRTYFYLAYGTRHPAGMEVFRQSEARCVAVQEQIVLESFQAKQELKLGMGDLFQGQQNEGLDAFRLWSAAAQAAARAQFEEWLLQGGPRRAVELRAELMEHPHVTATLVTRWGKEAQKTGRMTLSGQTDSTRMWHPVATTSDG